MIDCLIDPDIITDIRSELRLGPRAGSVCLCDSVCLFLVVFSVFFGLSFPSAVHGLSNWWRCFIHLLVFRLFACVSSSCGAVRCALRATVPLGISTEPHSEWFNFSGATLLLLLLLLSMLTVPPKKSRSGPAWSISCHRCWFKPSTFINALNQNK